MVETGRPSILMVDDEPKNLLALEAVLGGMDLDLVRADSGREALRQLIKSDFAAILLDVQMPDMDGFETAALIRSRERSRHTPIVFLTAVGTSQKDIFRGYEVGAVDYILKPYAPEILRYKVGVLAELHQKNEQIRQLNLGLEERVRERTAELEERGRELARSNQELAQFAAVASHDLQEPLRTLVTYLQLFTEDKKDLSSKDQECLGVILESSRRMRQLIRDLLAFSQVGSKERRLERVDCAALVQEVLVQLGELGRQRGAKVTVGPLPVVEAEPVLLGQVFQNLIGNAFKFVAKDRPPLVEVGARPGPNSNDGWTFWVRDHGIGINPEHFDKLFKLFRRLHTREEYPGSGLGLSICHKIVSRHGGRIWIESAEGQGTTFYFTLPSRVPVGHVLA